MPLPPISSRAQPTVSRIRIVQNALASDACSSASRPSSCSWETRVHIVADAVMLPSMRTSRSCTSWNSAIGLPNWVRSPAYVRACSYAPRAQPTADHATLARVIRSTLAVSRKLCASCSRFSSATWTPSSVISAFCTARSAILSSRSTALKPGVPCSTTNPSTRSVSTSRAQMITRSAKLPLPIHFFWPSSTHVSPSRRGGGCGPPAAPGGGPAGRRAQPTRDVGAGVRLGQPERPDQLHPGHRRQPPLLLLLGAAEVDGAHGQAAVHAHERGHRRVAAGQLHGEHPVGKSRAARTAVAGVLGAGDAELSEPRDEFAGKLPAGPVLVDDRLDLLVHELPDAVEQRPVVVAQQRLEVVEVRGDDLRFDGHGRASLPRGSSPATTPFTSPGMHDPAANGRWRAESPRALSGHPERALGALRSRRAQVVCFRFGSSRASSWISLSARGTPSLSSLLRSISASSSMPNSSATLVSQNQTRKITTPASAP